MTCCDSCLDDLFTLLDDLFTVLMPTQHTQTFSLSNLSLAEEIVDTDNGTADVGGDTEYTPCAVDESATDAANKCYQYILPCRIPYPSETQLVTKCG